VLVERLGRGGHDLSGFADLIRPFTPVSQLRTMPRWMRGGLEGWHGSGHARPAAGEPAS
jgi:hypothetical protein